MKFEDYYEITQTIARTGTHGMRVRVRVRLR